VSTGAKKDESSTGRVCAAGFNHVTARSRLACVLKLTKRLFLYFLKEWCVTRNHLAGNVDLIEV
jgi:hypothetical protein